MPAQSPGSFVGAGGGGSGGSPKDALCAAFEATVEKWAAAAARTEAAIEYEGADREPVPAFEDLFQDEVARSNPLTAKAMTTADPSLAYTAPECAILAAAATGDSASAKKAMATLCDDRDAKWGALKSVGEPGSTAIRIKSKFGDRFGAGKRVIPSAKLEDHQVVVEAPGDTENPKGEYAKLQALSKDEVSVQVGCRQCGSDCAKWE